MGRAVAANPRDFNSAYLLGTVLARQNETDAALRAWRGALALQPGEPEELDAGDERGVQQGAVLCGGGADGGGGVRLRTEELALYLVAIKARQDAGQHDEAFALARRALGKFPGSARANFEVGFHLHKLGRWDEAMPFFQKAIAAEGAYEEPHYFRGDVLLRREDFGGAEGAFRTALEKRADYTAARLGLARALMGQRGSWQARWRSCKRRRGGTRGMRSRTCCYRRRCFGWAGRRRRAWRRRHRSSSDGAAGGDECATGAAVPRCVEKGCPPAVGGGHSKGALDRRCSGRVRSRSCCFWKLHWKRGEAEPVHGERLTAREILSLNKPEMLCDSERKSSPCRSARPCAGFPGRGCQWRHRRRESGASR